MRGTSLFVIELFQILSQGNFCQDILAMEHQIIDSMLWSNKSLQATRDGGFSSASRFTLIGPACLSSGR